MNESKLHRTQQKFVEMIQASKRKKEDKLVVVPTRFPYTYAYDYMREHYEEFGLNPYTSRAECAGIVNKTVTNSLSSEYSEEQVQLVKYSICTRLAMQYLIQHKYLWSMGSHRRIVKLENTREYNPGDKVLFIHPIHSMVVHGTVTGIHDDGERIVIVPEENGGLCNVRKENVC